jgi:hypothetical protein
MHNDPLSNAGALVLAVLVMGRQGLLNLTRRSEQQQETL